MEVLADVITRQMLSLLDRRRIKRIDEDAVTIACEVAGRGDKMSEREIQRLRMLVWKLILVQAA